MSFRDCLGTGWDRFKERFLTYGYPCFDYSRDRWVGAIYLSGLAVTIVAALILQDDTRLMTWNWPTLGVSLIVFSMGLQILRERQLSKRTEDAEAASARAQADYIQKQNELNERQLELEKLLKTMPPSQALESLTESYQAMLNIWRTYLKGSQISHEFPSLALSQCEKAMRISLNAIARLYLGYEYKPLGCRCSAHFAEYIPLEDISSNTALKDRVLSGIRFVDYPDDPLHNLVGVLWIRPEMTGFAEKGNEDSWDPDPNLKRELYLPLPKGPMFDEKGRTRFLPIAPQAFELGLVAIPNIQEEGIESTKLNVSPSVLDDVREYLFGEEDGLLGSVIGYRLLWAGSNVGGEVDTDDGQGDIRLGVVTLFTERPNAKDDSSIDAFFNILRPLIELKKEFILAMMELRERVAEVEARSQSSKGE